MHKSGPATFAPKNHMKTNCSHLGIDVSKLKLDVTLLLSTTIHSASYPNTTAGFKALVKWLNRFNQPVHVCMEATGTYSLPVAHFLHARGFTVSIVNPMAIHFFARTQMSRNKTDAHDATLIALYSRQHQPRCWQPPSAARQQLQAVVRAREQLLESRVLAQQHLHSAPRAVAKLFKTQIRQLERHIARLEEQIRQTVKDNVSLAKAVELLTSIPGVGTLTAVTVLAIMPEIDQLESARQLAAFAGVTPSQRQSGTFTGRTHLSKFGHRRLRKALYFPALAALRSNGRVQAMAIRLAQKGKSKMVIVGAAMRLLTHLIFGVLKNQIPFDPDYLRRTAVR
jgi:transposase